MPPTGETVHVEGLENKDWVDLDYPPAELVCTVDPIKPKASIYWSINGEPQTDTETVSPPPYDNGTFKLVGTLHYPKFPKTFDKVDVSCLLTKENDPTDDFFTKPYEEVEVRCK